MYITYFHFSKDLAGRQLRLRIYRSQPKKKWFLNFGYTVEAILTQNAT